MKKRLWDDTDGDDPAAGLINLFDVWIAFAAALLLSVVSYMNQAPPDPAATSDASAQNAPVLDPLEAQRMRAERLQESRASKSGEGERLGTAYRLKSGEIIYVRDNKPAK